MLLPVPEHIQHAQPILARRGVVGGVERVAEHVAVLVAAIDAGWPLVQVLPGSTRQPRPVDRLRLSVPLLLPFDQQVGKLPSGDDDANILEHLGDLRFAHLAAVIPTQGQALQPRAKLATVPRRQGRQIGLPSGAGVPLLFAKADRVRPEHHVRVAFAYRIRGQRPAIHAQHLLPRDGQTSLFPAFAVLPWFPPLRFGGAVRPARLRRQLRQDRWLPLFAFEPIDLIVQPLALLPQRPHFRAEGFHHVQQPHGQRPRVRVQDAVKVNVRQHAKSLNHANAQAQARRSTNPQLAAASRLLHRALLRRYV